MSEPILIWKPNRGQFASGSSALLGNVWVFCYQWDAFRIRGTADPLPWKLTTSLPGFAGGLGNFKTEDEAKTAAEGALMQWLRRTNLVWIKP